MMYRLRLALVALLGCAACNPEVDAPTFVSMRGGFSVACPGEFGGHLVGTIVTPRGTAESNAILCRGDAGAFSVAYADLASDVVASHTVEELLDAALAHDRMHRLGLREQSRQWAATETSRSLTARFTGADELSETMLRRIVLVGNRIYTVCATVPSKRSDAPPVRRFFESFRTNVRPNNALQPIVGAMADGASSNAQ
jgi:hypothetical protein